ncbi:hypothetical protein BDZ91DRAFT_789205 [Kalaharituber pfeilii]|nr:hypothetical protein BDZ91DRAFT_789205 [Kalaharituber pfeilii]
MGLTKAPLELGEEGEGIQARALIKLQGFEELGLDISGRLECVYDRGDIAASDELNEAITVEAIVSAVPVLLSAALPPEALVVDESAAFGIVCELCCFQQMCNEKFTFFPIRASEQTCIVTQ